MTADSRALLWVDASQVRCCVAPVVVGDEVCWDIDGDPDREWLDTVLGRELASRVTHTKQHHCDAVVGALTHCLVIGIRSVHGRYERHPSSPWLFLLISGSAVLDSTDRVVGTETELREDLRLHGYLFEVEALSAPPRA